MRYSRRLIIAGDEVPIVGEDIALELYSPGRAKLKVLAEEPPDLNSSIAYTLGRAASEQSFLLFSGEIEKARQLDSQHVEVFCRQYSARLYDFIPLNLRHCTMRDVLTEVAKQTGLIFYLPRTHYSDVPVARYFNLGDGISAMDRLAEVYQVEDFYWQQEGQKEIYVGAWKDSRWPERIMPLPLDIMKPTGTHRAEVPAIPGLIPGIHLQEHGRLLSLRYRQEYMELRWSPSK